MPYANFSYSVRQSQRARHMRLTVYPDRRVVLTVPRRFSDLSLAERFLQSKTAWILRRLEYLSQAQAGKTILKNSRQDYMAKKELARQAVREIIASLKLGPGFEFKKLAIKNARRMWGSCSKRGNLNFNYKIIYLSEEARRYIIVHELCHLQEFNHSPRFWRNVEILCPDYQVHRAQLRQFSLR